MGSESGPEKFEFLRKLALEGGALEAQIVPASMIVVEDRVVLKCRIGCTHYGQTLACPPYTPSAAEFRKIVSEYGYALLIKFASSAEADHEVLRNLSKAESDVSIPEAIREKVRAFWAAWKADRRVALETLVSLEKAALKEGFPLAVSFVSGFCQLCEKCNTGTRICVHPELARWSTEAIGVNVQKTAKNAGIDVTFQIKKNPVSFGLLLID
jgi:predicted metal-binding protein